MKPVAFDYARPTSIAEALQTLAGRSDAKVLAGGQTLGPMLNLRLAQPALLVDITRIPELAAVSEDAHAVTIGAEVVCRLSSASRISFSETGSSMSYQCGFYGAALAAARLMGLPRDEARHALLERRDQRVALRHVPAITVLSEGRPCLLRNVRVLLSAAAGAGTGGHDRGHFGGPVE